jgi:hypothetical protein
MFFLRVRVLNLGHKAKLLREAWTISSLVPVGTTGEICMKSLLIRFISL